MMNASEVAAALSLVAEENPSPSEILISGLFYVGFDQNRQTRNNSTRKNNWFKAFYGVEPTTVANHFLDMKSIDANITCKKYLLALNWLFLYDTYPVLSGRWNYSEELIGRTVMRYVMLMATAGRRKIVFELEHDVKLGRTVDCSTFMVQEMRLDPSAKWFDFKTHSCGLVSIPVATTLVTTFIQTYSNTLSPSFITQKYEFCLATREPRILSIRGPYPPSVHDITIFRGGDPSYVDSWDTDSLYFKLGEGEKCVGDSGYNGEPDKIVVKKKEHSLDLRKFLSRARTARRHFILG